MAQEELTEQQQLIYLEKNLEDMQIEIGYTLKNGSLRTKTFFNLRKAFNFWMNKPDGMASIITNLPTYSAYTHREHFGLRVDEFTRDIIYKGFLEGITMEE